MHRYEVRPIGNSGDAVLTSEMLPWGRLQYGGPNAVENAVGYAKFFSGAHETEVTVFDAKGEVVAVNRWDARTPRDLVV
jgi:hypothetical protein